MLSDIYMRILQEAEYQARLAEKNQTTEPTHLLSTGARELVDPRTETDRRPIAESGKSWITRHVPLISS